MQHVVLQRNGYFEQDPGFFLLDEKSFFILFFNTAKFVLHDLPFGLKYHWLENGSLKGILHMDENVYGRLLKMVYRRKISFCTQ